MVVDAAATRIKHKTAIAILEHIADVLPVQNARFFAPIRNDYLKSFRSLLQNHSFREHLRPQDWEALIDFIVEGLDIYCGEDDSQGSGTNSRDASIDTRTESRASLLVSQVSRGRTIRSDANSHVEELVISLKLLTSTNNTALRAKLGFVVDGCLNYLSSATKYQEPVLEALNNVFPIVLTEDIALARNAGYRFIPILRRMWSSRIGTLKEQLLIFLMNASDLFSSPTPNNPSSTETSLLIDLFGTMTLEYGRRQEKECLQMDDIYFPNDTKAAPLSTLTLAPLRDSPRASASWVCVSVLAVLASTLHVRHSSSRAAEYRHATPSKREKIEGPMEELIRQAQNSSTQERLCAIQTLLFAFDIDESMGDRLAEHIAQLAPGLSSENDSIANWSMLLMSR